MCCKNFATLCLVIGTAGSVTAETKFAVMTHAFHCAAATLARVTPAKQLLASEALELIGGETLCTEESSVLTVDPITASPTVVEIVKPPASVDMTEAGYLVIVRQVMELALVEQEL